MKTTYPLLLLILVLSACSGRRYVLQDPSDEKMVLVDIIKASPELADKPLIVVDGKPFRYDVELKKEKLPILASDIHDVRLMKSDKGVPIWGDAAKDGVLLITSIAGQKLKEKSKVMIDCSQPLKKQKILFMLGDRTITESEMKVIDPDEIESVSILKEAEDIKKYTSEAYDGLVIITLKSKE